MKKHFISGVILLTVSSVIFMISGYLINVWLGRKLGPEMYGIYGLLISIVSMVNITQSAGITQSVSKYVSGSPNESDSILKAGLIIQVLYSASLFVLFYFFPQVIKLITNDASLISYSHLIAFIFPIYGIYALYSDFYNGLHNFTRQAVMNILYSVSKLIGIVFLATQYHLSGVIIGFICAPILSLFIGFKLPNSQSNYPLKKIVSFSLLFVLFSLVANLVQSIDLFFVKYLLQSNSLTGFYVASQNIAKIPYFLLSSLFLIIFPTISGLMGSGDQHTLKKVITITVRFVLIIISIVTIVISIGSRFITLMIYSPTYSPAVPIVALLVLGFSFYTIFILLSYILSGAGFTKIPLTISLIGIVLTSMLAFWLIPIYSIPGAALSTVMGSLLMMVLALHQVCKRFSIQLTELSLLKIISVSFLTYITGFLLLLTKIHEVFVLIILILIYVVLIFYLKLISREDINKIINMLPSKVKKYIPNYFYENT